MDFNSLTSSLIFLFSSRKLLKELWLVYQVTSLVSLLDWVLCDVLPWLEVLLWRLHLRQPPCSFSWNLTSLVRSLGIWLLFFYGAAFITFVLSTSSSHMIVAWVIPCLLILKNDWSLLHWRGKFGTKTAVLKRVHHATSMHALLSNNNSYNNNISYKSSKDLHNRRRI